MLHSEQSLNLESSPGTDPLRQGPMTTAVRSPSEVMGLIKWLTFLMFMMFAMTTDSVGVIIPEVIKEYHG